MMLFHKEEKQYQHQCSRQKNSLAKIPQFQNGKFKKKKGIASQKINTFSPQVHDVKFYNQGLQICNYGMSATFKQAC